MSMRASGVVATTVVRCVQESAVQCTRPSKLRVKDRASEACSPEAREGGLARRAKDSAAETRPGCTPEAIVAV